MKLSDKEMIQRDQALALQNEMMRKELVDRQRDEMRDHNLALMQ
jgi:hypothetical protein